MVGSFAGRKRRRTDRTWRCRRSGKAGLEPYRAEERLLRLGQENCLREARIVEAAAEVHARLDREYLELIDRESRPRQVERVHRSEERRVGKECRCRGSTERSKKQKTE